MKIEYKLTIVSSLLLIVGCAHHERYTQYDRSVSSPGYVHSTTAYDHRSSTYNDYIPTPAPASQVSVDQTPAPGTSITSPATTGLTDQTVILQVRQALNNNPNLTEVVPNIQITGTGGAITLMGTVPSEQQKQAVETLAKSTTGVVNVNNQLQVSLSPTSSKTSEPSGRIYSNVASQPESALPSSATASTNSSLSISNKIERPGSGLTPASDRPTQEPRLYSTNDTGNSSSPQSSVNGGQPQSSLSVGTVQETTDSRQLNPGSSSTLSSSVSSTNNPAVTETKELSPTSNTRQTTTIYSNGQSSAASPNISGETARSASSSTENKQLSPTSNNGSQSRLYSTSQSVSNSTPASAGSFEVNVQGNSETDRALGQKIILELRADRAVAATIPMVKINIENGKATLRGTAKSEEEKQKIESDVQKVTGVTSVENNLQIGLAPKDTDRAQ